jgi:hypothetical protein
VFRTANDVSLLFAQLDENLDGSININELWRKSGTFKVSSHSLFHFESAIENGVLDKSSSLNIMMFEPSARFTAFSCHEEKMKMTSESTTLGIPTPDPDTDCFCLAFPSSFLFPESQEDHHLLFYVSFSFLTQCLVMS